MPQTTIKMALVSALEDLSKGDFEKFCHQLLDRRQEPRVKRNKVEDKNRLQITDVLVSHFTEEGALRVAVEILKQIGCSEEAQTLETLAGGQSSKPGPSDGEIIFLNMGHVRFALLVFECHIKLYALPKLHSMGFMKKLYSISDYFS
uniref:Pyrin domain-containing protein n=1 Tax=Amphilophus citrinellus TaxID=61819 RepID=A0A3Q0T8A5_AMPCI